MNFAIIGIEMNVAEKVIRKAKETYEIRL